jgi:hypothetical protein
MEQTTHNGEGKNKGNWELKPEMIIGFIGVIILLIFIFGAIQAGNNKAGSNSPSPTTVAQAIDTPAPTEALTTPKPTPTFTPTPTEMQYDSNGFPEDAARITVSELAKIPSSYQDKKITFTCDVVSFPKDENGNAAGVNCSDPNDYSAIVQVRMAAFDQTVKVNTNDTVVVYGIGQGAAQGTNAFGADVTEAEVLELHLKDLTTGYSE